MGEVTPASVAPAAPDATKTPNAHRVTPVALPRAKRSVAELRTREHRKTPAQRTEDVAYTINHAVSCGTTDVFIVPTIAAGFKPSQVGYFKELTGYLGGEIIGDFAAVPLTIAVQRCFPGFMEMVGRVVDPLAKPLFQHGARTAAERWGNKHGLDASNAEVVARAEAIYQHEMQHLPQAVVWNLFSFPLGIAGQKWMGHEGGWGHVAKSKLLGTAISNVLLIGGRALLPDKAEKFDRLDGRYIIRPVTRAVSSLVGLDRSTVDRMEQAAEQVERSERHRLHQERKLASWQARVAPLDETKQPRAASPAL